MTTDIETARSIGTRFRGYLCLPRADMWLRDGGPPINVRLRQSARATCAAVTAPGTAAKIRRKGSLRASLASSPATLARSQNLGWSVIPNVQWSGASDDALLLATRSDADAFAAFYDRYEAAVIGYMLRRTPNVEIAIDLASETFAAALASAHRYTSGKGTAAAWLFTIAHHTLADSLRRGRVETRARRRMGIRDAIEYTTEDLERIEARASRSDWATSLLDGLPIDQREAVCARIIDERSYTEIARDMKTSELVVRKRVSRGLAALREHLEEST